MNKTFTKEGTAMKAMNWVVAIGLVGGLGACAVDDASGADPSVASTEQAATTDVWHGTWNGASANASSYDWNGSAYIDVFENKTQSARYAYLNFSKWGLDTSAPQHCVDYVDWWSGQTFTYCFYSRYIYQYGWGQIPQQDFQVTPNHARVKTTLPATFAGYSCTWDWWDWTGSCTTVAGGDVDVSFDRNGGYSVTRAGTDQTEYGPYSFKTQGTAHYSSATASGSIIGLSFNAWGSFGDTHQTNVSKYVIQTPH